jgi:translation initiation factor 1
VSRDSNSRLVYSTDGPVPSGGPSRSEKKRHEPARKSNEPSRTDGSRIRIRLDRRASDRVVTVVSGLPGSTAEIAALAKALKSACGTGGTVKDGELELQGDHRDKVEVALTARGLASKRSGG